MALCSDSTAARNTGKASARADLRSGKVHWSHEDIRPGSVSRVGDRLVLLLESGELMLVAASPEGFEVKARARFSPGRREPFLPSRAVSCSLATRTRWCACGSGASKAHAVAFG